MFCDDCGDLVTVAVPIRIIFPDGSELEILMCLDCWRKFERLSRKLKVAKMLKILKE